MEGSGSNLITCEICGQSWKAKGIVRHRNACQREKDEREARGKYLRQKKESSRYWIETCPQ